MSEQNRSLMECEARSFPLSEGWFWFMTQELVLWQNGNRQNLNTIKNESSMAIIVDSAKKG